MAKAEPETSQAVTFVGDRYNADATSAVEFPGSTIGRESALVLAKGEEVEVAKDVLAAIQRYAERHTSLEFSINEEYVAPAEEAETDDNKAADKKALVVTPGDDDLLPWAPNAHNPDEPSPAQRAQEEAERARVEPDEGNPDGVPVDPEPEATGAEAVATGGSEGPTGRTVPEDALLAETNDATDDPDPDSDGDTAEDQ